MFFYTPPFILKTVNSFEEHKHRQKVILLYDIHFLHSFNKHANTCSLY